MGIYSVKGSDAFDARLDRDFQTVARSLAESDVGALCRALVLLGGYGRSEGTPRIIDGRQEPFNDYDFVVVSVPMSRHRGNAVQARLRLLEQQLSHELGLPVDLQLYLPNNLPRAEFSLLNYEMKYGHKVIWGEPDVLNTMPPYPHDQIPLSEGTRLLLNRGKLLLDIRRALRTGRDLTPDERLRFAKFLFKAQLAVGDCFLLMTRAYDVSYTIKKERINGVDPAGVPDPGFLAQRYREAIALKEWGDYSFLPGFPLPAEFELIRNYYLRFFQWYESARLHAKSTAAASGPRAAFSSPDEPPAWKRAALNAQAFGMKALTQGSALWRAHPRLRLYRALPLLLADEPLDYSAIATLLGLSNPTPALAEDRFYQLQKRFS